MSKEKYWENCGFREFKGKLQLLLHGFSIWCRQIDVYSRMNVNEISAEFIMADCIANTPYAEGERLIIRVQGFKPILKEELKNKEKVNEVSLWLTKDAAVKLRKFLNQVLPKKLSEFVEETTA